MSVEVVEMESEAPGWFIAIIIVIIVVGCVCGAVYQASKDLTHAGQWGAARIAVEKNICLSDNPARTPEICECEIEVAESRGLTTLKGIEFTSSRHLADIMDRCPSEAAKYLRAWEYLQERNGKQ